MLLKNSKIANPNSQIMHVIASNCKSERNIEKRDVRQNKQKVNDGIKNVVLDETYKFTEVFDTVNFPENEDISKYMTLETQLSKKKSVCLLTYGYSGTGKTYTAVALAVRALKNKMVKKIKTVCSKCSIKSIF